MGLLGTKPSWDLMKGCDTFLMVGSAFPYSEFLPKPGDARGVQIDIDGGFWRLLRFGRVRTQSKNSCWPALFFTTMINPGSS